MINKFKSGVKIAHKSLKVQLEKYLKIKPKKERRI